jgi:hypothetical protein
MKNPGEQLDMFDKENIPNPPNLDSKGRSFEDIKKASKSLKQEVLDSIELKDREWYIEGKLADDWIKIDEELNNIDNWTDI